jgi:hypothetical protein
MLYEMGTQPPPRPRVPSLLPIQLIFLILVVASLGLMIVVGIQSWQEIHSEPKIAIWVNDGTKAVRDQVAADIKTTFEWYRDRVDNLQKLVALLVGLSSLYALVLAAVGYINVQSSLKELTLAGKAFVDDTETQANAASAAVLAAQKHLEEAEATSKDLKEKFKAFTNVGENLKDLSDSVSKVLPDTELEGGIEQAYDSMSSEAKERIYFQERSLAFAGFITSDGSGVVDRELSMAFMALARFYRASFKAARKRATVGLDWAVARSAWAPEQREIFSFLDRALLYSSMAVNRDLKNYSAWTELGISRMASSIAISDAAPAAREAFDESLRLRDEQQKVRYQLSILQHRAGEYGNAEITLTNALARTLWEDREVRERLPDLYYNRACARARLASKAGTPDDQQAFAKAALEDLSKGCPQADTHLLEIFTEDCNRGGDLEYLATYYHNEVAQIEARLKGNQPSI